MLSYDKLKDKPREFLAATGLALAEFESLLPVFQTAYERGSCWIPGSWMCRGRLIVVTLSSSKPFFVHGLKKAVPFSGDVGAEDPGIQ
jgi:hypothetical protein